MTIARALPKVMPDFTVLLMTVWFSIRSSLQLGHKTLQQGIDQLRLITVGIMARILQPDQGNPGAAMPGFVISPGGTRLILPAAEQQRRAVDAIRQVCRHRLGQHPVSMACQCRISGADPRYRHPSSDASAPDHTERPHTPRCRTKPAAAKDTSDRLAPSAAKDTALPR